MNNTPCITGEPLTDFLEAIKVSDSEGSDPLNFTENTSKSLADAVEHISIDIARRAKETPSDEKLLRDVKFFIQWCLGIERINLAKRRLGMSGTARSAKNCATDPLTRNKAAPVESGTPDAAAVPCGAVVPAVAAACEVLPKNRRASEMSAPQTDAGETPALQTDAGETPALQPDAGETPALRVVPDAKPSVAPVVNRKAERKTLRAQRRKARRSSSSVASGTVASSRSDRPTPTALESLNKLESDAGGRESYPWDEHYDLPRVRGATLGFGV
jgi:hypothetical protein